MTCTGGQLKVYGLIKVGTALVTRLCGVWLQSQVVISVMTQSSLGRDKIGGGAYGMHSFWVV